MTMKSNLTVYTEALTEKVIERIGVDLPQINIAELISRRNSADKSGRKFNAYLQFYYELMQDANDHFINDEFFSSFIHHYSLRGIDKKTIGALNSSKKEIKELIDNDELVKLYFMYFHEVNTAGKTKSLGSFFTKLVHTFKPEEITQIDIGLKKHFKLEHESYFISMIVVSAAFLRFSEGEPDTLLKLQKHLSGILPEIDKFYSCKCHKGKRVVEISTTQKNLFTLNFIFWLKSTEKA